MLHSELTDTQTLVGNSIEFIHDNERSQSKSRSVGSVIVISLIYLFVHGLLFGFDLVNGSSLLSGDRSTSRNATIAYVFDVEKIGGDSAAIATNHATDAALSFKDRVLGSGHAGDYFIQGVVLVFSNQYVLVLLQVVLGLISTLCFFALLRHFGFSVSTATVTTLFYLLLPGSLLPAHQLSTEAFCIPSLIIACYLLVISSEKKGISISFVAGLLALSLAIFIRPQLILFPFALFVVYFCFSVKKFSTVSMTVIPLSLFFSLIWMGVVVLNNGQFSLGGNDRSIGRSFHDTAEQMAMAGEFEFDDSAYKSRVMPFVDFVEIVADHTPSYLRQRMLSMINFSVNSGAYSLAVRHLEFFDEHKDMYYWQHLRARSGIYESFIQILKQGPGFSTVIIGSTLAWCLIMVFAFIGLKAFIKNTKTKNFAKALLLSLAAYQVGIVLLFSVGARWQHRSLVDFIIVILAVYGLKVLQQYLGLNKVKAKKLSAVN